MAVNLPARRAGQIAYGVLFLVLLPAALLWWARALDALTAPPAIHWPVGWLIAMLGVAVWSAGVFEIVRRGSGLPMNAFPPAKLVTTGIYAWVAHPIYAGWTIACAGVSLATGSGAGLWIVTPVVALGCASLVLGYERHDLRRRFGAAAVTRPWLHLPPDTATRPTTADGVAVWFLVLVPWLILYQSVNALGVPPDAFDVRFEFEKAWPVWLWTVPVYASAYVVVPIAALMAPTGKALRKFAIQGLVATGVLTLAYLVAPTIAPYREADLSGFWGGLLAADRALASSPVEAFPAFHVLWAAFAAEVIALRSRGRAVAAWTWAGLVAVSCVTTGMHAIADVVGAALVWIPLRQPDVIWRWMLDAAERLANSWHSRRLGPARVIGHGVFAGLAAFAGVATIGTLAGTESLTAVAILTVAVLAGAGLWAQLVEGSPALLRPFGYYGGILGGIAGALIIAIAIGPSAVVLAAAATAAPWAQAIGRLRCLVQGCCHGGPTDAECGIRVTNPHSRVVTLAHLSGQPIHATQLYSIVANVVIGVLLLRLWTLGFPVWFITGGYLLLAGLARFAEEGFRAEPQTITWRGLPIYQHLAIASVIIGVALTTMGGPLAPTPGPVGDLRVLGMALGFGALYWFAMGVDFPDSNRRFARLSG